MYFYLHQVGNVWLLEWFYNTVIISLDNSSMYFNTELIASSTSMSNQLLFGLFKLLLYTRDEKIDCNLEYAIDYPGITSKIIIDGLRDGDIISEETISKLEPELDSIICFMSCASVSHLIDSFKEFVKSKEEN